MSPNNDIGHMVKMASRLLLGESIIFLCKSSSVFDTWAFNEEWLCKNFVEDPPQHESRNDWRGWRIFCFCSYIDVTRCLCFNSLFILYNWTLSYPESLNYWSSNLRPFQFSIWKHFHDLTHFGSFEKSKSDLWGAYKPCKSIILWFFGICIERN